MQDLNKWLNLGVSRTRLMRTIRACDPPRTFTLERRCLAPIEKLMQAHYRTQTAVAACLGGSMTIAEASATFDVTQSRLVDSLLAEASRQRDIRERRLAAC